MTNGNRAATVHALLVGIDSYQAAGIPPLQGCKNDIADANAFLARLVAQERLRLLTLTDGKATREAVIDGIRTHLGAADQGDTAVFWFSGHGSLAPVPEHLRHLEPSGTSQTLVCADSRLPGVPDLQDYELATLIDEIAQRSVHVLAILDCCHAGGASRGFRVRQAPPVFNPPALNALLVGLRSRDGTGAGARRRRGNHVALTACQIHQTAQERRHNGAVRGAFTTALLAAANSQGEQATYRELMVAARCAIEDQIPNQHPLLYPAENALVDQPFLGGASRAPRSGMVMRHVHDHWEIDAGSCHGLTLADADDPVLIGVAGAMPPREAMLTRVDVVSSQVEPVGWLPLPTEQYPMVLTRVPMPPTLVAVSSSTTEDRALADRIEATIRTGGPGGGPSPYVRTTPQEIDAPLRVVAPAGRPPWIVGKGGERLTPPIVTEGDPAPVVLAQLEHIARWHQVKKLRNDRSRLAGLVSIEMILPLPSNATAPLEGPAIVPDAEGVIRLRYDPHPPTAFIRLRNRSDRRLYCSLLDLTDRYRIHPELFPGEYLGPGQVGTALEGQRVEFALPPGRAAEPGARCRDWLLLLVAEQQFSSAPFALGRLGEPEPVRNRGLPGITGVLERLGMAAMTRDAGRAAPSAQDWTTAILEVVTEVPTEACALPRRYPQGRPAPPPVTRPRPATGHLKGTASSALAAPSVAPGQPR